MDLRASARWAANALLLPVSLLAAILVLSGATALPAAASDSPDLAGPWSIGRNGYWSTMRLLGLSSSTSYDAVGNKVDLANNGKFSDLTAQLASEYGLSERWTLDLGLPVQFLSAESDALEFDEKNKGFGDARVGVRYGLNDPAGSNVLAVQVDGSVPTGYNAAGNGRPPMGNGEPALTGRLLAGHAFAGAMYAQGEFGYRMNFGDVSPQLVAGAEAGIFPTPRLLVLGQYTWVKHTDDQKPVYEYEYALGGQAQYRLNRQLDLVGGIRHTLGGMNVPAGTSIVLGLSLKGNSLAPYRGQAAADAREGVFPGFPAPADSVPAPAQAPAAPALPDSVPAPAPPPPDSTQGGTPTPGGGF
ncbi:MAG: transporter [Candidatus Eiseniibacteriota bacterium]